MYATYHGLVSLGLFSQVTLQNDQYRCAFDKLRLGKLTITINTSRSCFFMKQS
ncbi:hypothetical protein PCCS19_46330 [Paenibacillus sp. CCS19]|nr:hypothetical protein PCCS19_46330 [Paenibacillus cellulosilyticus]